MPDTPTRGPSQPQDPTFMARLTAIEAKERAARFMHTFEYEGPRWPWMYGTKDNNQ